jgi:quercetin dioxygenase-like cupin family protein
MLKGKLTFSKREMNFSEGDVVFSLCGDPHVHIATAEPFAVWSQAGPKRPIENKRHGETSFCMVKNSHAAMQQNFPI